MAKKYVETYSPSNAAARNLEEEVQTVMMSVRCGDSNPFIVWLTIYWYGPKSIDLSVRLHHLAVWLISLSDVTLNVLNYTLQLSIIVI